jgi:pimeloyl-ACP methyl ester carboxylesterase
MEERLAEAVTDDMLALVDHLGLERAAVVGGATGPVLFAASHPERTKALVLIDGGARVPVFVPQAETNEYLEQLRRRWGTGASLDLIAPSVAGDARLRRWLGRSQRLLCTADEMVWRMQANLAVDVRPALSAVQAPTLFVYRQGLRNASLIREDAQQIWSCPGLTDRLVRPRRRRCLDGCVRSTLG